MPTQQRAKATREHILSTSAVLFGERGVARTSTNRIAATAGISIGTLYRYFPDQFEIARELVGQVIMEVETRFTQHVLDVRIETMAPTVEAYSALMGQALQMFAEVMAAHAALIKAFLADVSFSSSGLAELEPRLRILNKHLLTHIFGPLEARKLDTMAFVLVSTGYGAVWAVSMSDTEATEPDEILAATARMLGAWLHKEAVAMSVE